VRVLGIVPARGGSRRVERKNLRVLGGETLVRRTLLTALGAGRLTDLCLSSEDEEILGQAHGLEAVTVLRRPDELATDTSLAFDMVKHALAAMEADGETYDAVAIMQCTSPFTQPDDIDGALELMERSGAESVVTVGPVEGVHHPLKLKLMDGDRLTPWLEEDSMKPSHSLPQLWARNGSVYATRRETIASGVFISENALGYRMPPERSHDVDTPLDLAFCEFLVERGLA